MLGPLLCGLLSQASLLPKLRDHFAEFLGNASPAGLGILSLSACVGLRYGPAAGHSGFSRRILRALRYFFFAPPPARAFRAGIVLRARPCPAPGFPFPARTSDPRPRISAAAGRRNLHLLPFGCALRPLLRTRLSQGRRASPWKPRTSGPEDSHLRLATHSGILPSYPSTAPSGTASAALRMLPYRCTACTPRLRRRVSAPDIFGAGTLGQWAVTHSLNAWLLLGQRPGCL